MTSLQGAIKWFHKGLGTFLENIDIYLSERNCVVSGKSTLEAPLILGDAETIS